MTITREEIINSLSDLNFNSYNYVRNTYHFEKGDDKLYKLLEIYSFGTINDYLESKDQLDELNESQLLKLRLLTLISNSEGLQELNFQTIKNNLSLSDNDKLLNNLLTISSSSLINFKIDQLNKKIIIKSNPSSRDLFTKQDKPLILLKLENVPNLDDPINYLNEFVNEKLSKVSKKVDFLRDSIDLKRFDSKEEQNSFESENKGSSFGTAGSWSTSGVKRRLEDH